MATADQENATREVVAAMIDGAAEVGERLHPDEPTLARFDDLPTDTQNTLCSAMHPLLATLMSVLQKYGEPDGREED